MTKINREEIYKRIYLELDSFMKRLPDELKEKMGLVPIYFENMNLCYSRGHLVLAYYHSTDNSLTFFLENIKRTRKTSRKEIRNLIEHEFGHLFGMNEEEISKYRF